MLTSRDLTNGSDPMSYAEIDELKRLMGMLPKNPFVINVGAADGVSTLAFCEARKDSVIWSIDVEVCEKELINLDKAGFGRNRIVRVLAPSQVVGASMVKSVNFVFVDGNHRYDGVKGDIDAWYDKILSGGIISFHDYIENPPPNNVTEAWAAVNEAVQSGNLMGWKCLGVVDRIISFQKEN